MVGKGTAKAASKTLNLECIGHKAIDRHTEFKSEYTVIFDPVPFALFADRITLSRSISHVVVCHSRRVYSRVYENMEWNVNFKPCANPSIHIRINKVHVTAFPDDGKLVYTACKSGLERNFDIDVKDVKQRPISWVRYATFNMWAMIECLCRLGYKPDDDYGYYVTLYSNSDSIVVGDRTLVGNIESIERALRVYDPDVGKLYGCNDDCATQCPITHMHDAFDVWMGHCDEIGTLPNISRKKSPGCIEYPRGGKIYYNHRDGIYVKRCRSHGYYPVIPTTTITTGTNVTLHYIRGDDDPMSHLMPTRTIKNKYNLMRDKVYDGDHDGRLVAGCRHCIPDTSRRFARLNIDGNIYASYSPQKYESDYSYIEFRSILYRTSTHIPDNACTGINAKYQCIDNSSLKRVYSDKLSGAVGPICLGIPAINETSWQHMLHDYHKGQKIKSGEFDLAVPWVIDPNDGKVLKVPDDLFKQLSQMYVTFGWMTHPRPTFTPQPRVTDKLTMNS
jgi:hypothetical protein